MNEKIPTIGELGAALRNGSALQYIGLDRQVATGMLKQDGSLDAVWVYTLGLDMQVRRAGPGNKAKGSLIQVHAGFYTGVLASRRRLGDANVFLESRYNPTNPIFQAEGV